MAWGEQKKILLSFSALDFLLICILARALYVHNFGCIDRIGDFLWGTGVNEWAESRGD
jgi:hypothetical protein